MSTIAENFDYFVENQAELVGKYNGKILVIRDRQVVGAYQNHLEAYYAAVSQYPLGSFIIQTCIAGPNAYTISLVSQQVRFA